MAVDTTKGEFLTPKLRLVQGDAFKAQDKDMDGKLLVNDDGTPYVKYFIAAAGRKGDPGVEAFKAQLEAEARKAWPALFQGPGGTCTNPNFAYKYIDGDGYDTNGVANSGKEGFAGHWVFRFSTGFPPKIYALGKYDPMTDQLAVVNGVNPVPRGYFIRVAGTIKSNGNAKKPGISVYHNMVEFNEVGPLIVSGPNAASVFGGGGGSPAFTMTAKANGLTREQYLATPGWTDALLIEQGYMTAAAPVPVPVQPHTAILAPAPAPLAPAGSAPAPPAPAQIALAAAGFKMANPAGATYQTYIDAGWTDAGLVQHGHMVPV